MNMEAAVAEAARKIGKVTLAPGSVHAEMARRRDNRIRDMLNRGHSVREIAASVDCSVWTVRKVMRG